MIIARLSGGMGNQMFQYAVARTLAIKNNTTVGLDVHDLLDRTPRKNFTFRNYDLDLFNVEGSFISQKSLPVWHRSWGKSFFLNKIRRFIFGGVGQERGFKFKPEILAAGDGIYLDGYFQSHKYFESVTDVIRKDFTFKKPFSEYIENLKKEILSTNSVCLHVRRGDYVDNSFHDVVTLEYYSKAINLLSQKINLDKIYVFSDDIKWCRKNISFEYPISFIDEEYSAERSSGHFELMRSCKHFIIANSSFSWWAAYLAENKEKIVIAPLIWFGDKNISTDHRTPSSWLRI
jgi:hypothetical protein